MEQGADWLTFFSGSSVEHFHERFHLPKLLERFPQMRIATLGPQATHALQRLGIEPTVEVSPHTMEAMVEALQEAFRPKRKNRRRLNKFFRRFMEKSKNELTL